MQGASFSPTMAECGGVVFTVAADGNAVAVVERDGAAARAVASESSPYAGTRTRRHVVLVPGDADGEASSVFLVTVREDQRRVVAVRGYRDGCECEGVVFTVTERNEVAVVEGYDGAATRVLGTESFLDAAGGTRRKHFVDVQGKADARLFLVTVCEDQRRVVFVQRC